MIEMKYRYRKVTPEILSNIIKLKNMGYNLRDIAFAFGIARSTVDYHLNDKIKERAKERAKKRSRNKNLTNEQKIKWKIYYKRYFKDRYHEDKEFRDKHKKVCKNYYMKKNEAKK